MTKMVKFHKKDEGKCVGIIRGKVVARSSTLSALMQILSKKYPGEESVIATVPLSNMIFIL